MNSEKIGKFITEKRKLKNLTQKELAEKVGISDKAVSKWESGRGCPDISIIEDLAKTLDTSIVAILKGEEITEEMIDEMASVVHDEWLKRNDWVFDKEYWNPVLAQKYQDLPEEEKEKDRVQVRQAIAKIKSGK